jgi:hypothetical protein
MKPAAAKVWCGVGPPKVCLSFLSICSLAAMSPAGISPAHGGPVPLQAAAGGATRSFTLKYVESASLGTRLSLGQQEVRFRKEPEFGKKDSIVRQALKIGQGDDDYIGFAVNLTTRMLYMDLNRNLDLTDDPKGIYRSVVLGGANTTLSYFRGVRLALHDGGIERSYLLEPFYVLNNSTGYVGVRSSYQGEVDVGGQTWLFQVQDNLDGRFDAQDKFLITNVARRGGPKGMTYAAMPLMPDVCVGGREYRMKVAFVAGTRDPSATVAFEELSPPMSELALEGQFILRLVLLRGNAHLAVLDDPEQKAHVPAGEYSIHNAYLQQAPGQPALVATSWKARFTAPAGSVCELRVGAPFVSLVAAERKGNMLQLRYVLRGAAGEEYTISNPNRNNPPQFVIYLGDRVVAHGRFQFG